MSDGSTTPNTISNFSIAEGDAFNSFMKFLHKQNKRAIKLGIEPLTHAIAGDEYIEVPNTGKYIRMLNVFVFGDKPIINGYELVAIIDQKEKLVTNLVKDIYVENLRYVEKCDHCQVTRKRNNMFVFKSEGNTVLVGSSCAKDYTGHYDAEQIAAFYNGLIETLETYNNTHSTKGRTYFDLAEFLSATIAITQKSPFVSRSRAYETGEVSTSSKVLDWFCLEPENLPSEVDPLAEAMIKYVLDYTGEDNDYTFNLKTICSSGMVSYKSAGYAASIVPFYNKSLSKPKSTTASEFLGIVGGKLEHEATVTQINAYNSNFGTFFITRLVDSDGNFISLKSSSRLPIMEGNAYRFSGKIIEHKMFGSNKTTILNRVKIL